MTGGVADSPSFPDGPEVALPAGDVTVGVVRIGETVRRPHQPTSADVATYLAHLEAVGFGGAPRYLGRDDSGRDVLTFVPGDVPGDPVEPWARADGVLPGVGRLLRRLHDASAGCTLELRPGVPGRPAPLLPQDEPRMVLHRDVTPQNTVFRDGQACAVVDFDLVGPSTRPTDVVNTAMHWVPLADPADRPADVDEAAVARRFALLLGGYGTDLFGWDRLARAATLRFAGAEATMRWNAENLGGGWARMWEAGLEGVIRRRVAWFARVEPTLGRIVCASTTSRS